MKTNQTWRTGATSRLALLTGFCLLAVSLEVCSTRAAGAGKRVAVFSEAPAAGALPAADPNSPPSATPPPPTPAVPPTPVPPAQPATTAVPPTPATDATQGKTLYSFQAADLDLRAALASFARANNLNIVPDNDVAGSVTLDVRNLPLDLMMRALLEASDCVWEQQGGLIRVHSSETRTFYVDYLRLSRKGIGQSSAMLASGTSGGGMGGGMGGGTGGGMGGGMGGGNGGTSGGAGSGATSFGGSSVNLTADNPIDFWKEMQEELGFILTDLGKHSLSINRTAGVIQVTDRPSALHRIETYLRDVEKSVHRQVDLEAKIYDVTLSDQFQFGIDWVHVATAYGGLLGFGGSTLPVQAGGAQLQNSALGGINRNVGSTAFGDNLSTLVFSNFNTAAAVNALQLQGNVEVISKPRVRTLNNQTALIKVGEDVPFFNTSTTFLPGVSQGTSTTVAQTMVNTITVGTILSITPQISDSDWISLDISPTLTRLNAVVPFNAGGSDSSGSSAATAPDLDTKQASTLVRVHDGTTVVLGGLIQTQTVKNENKIPLLGDIPYLGKWLFTGTFKFKQKKELVIFVTPRIVRDNEPSVPSNLEERMEQQNKDPKKKWGTDWGM
jgi:MSHA biogenesis protein MshL